MKAITLTSMIMLLIPITSFGQVQFIAHPDADREEGKLFAMNYASAGADTLPADTFKVVTYSLFLQQNIAEELLYYDRTTRTFHGFSSVSCSCYHVPGPEPVKDSLRLTLYGKRDTVLTGLSSFSIAKNLPVFRQPVRKSKITVHGQVRSENYLSDGYFDHQALPLNYSRNALDMQLSIGALPFRTGFLYTTESADINSFYFSFDYNTYKNNLVKQLNEDRARKAANNLNNDTRINEQLARIGHDRFQIDNELKSPDYQKKLGQYKKDVAYGETDTAFRHTKRYRRAMLSVETDSLKRVQYNDLEKLEEKIHAESAKVNPKLYSKDAIADERKLKAEYKETGLEQPAFGIFNAVRRFDIGTFSPRYSVLMLDGVQAFGLNLELNKGAAYLAICGGELRSGLINYGIYNRYRTTFTAARVGVKQDKKYSLIFTGLRGNGRSRNASAEVPDQYLSNQVFGAEASYFITKSIQVRAEYARSTQSDEETKQYAVSLLEPQRNEPVVFSGAWLLNASYYSPKATTQLDLGLQQTGPGYFSVAAPYIRRDNRKVEMRLNQKLYKSIWSMFASVRADRDNLYDTKSGTTRTNWFTLGTKISPARLPFVVLSVSPLWQYTEIPSQQTTILNKVNLYNVLVGYNHFGQWIVNTVTFNYVKNSTYAMLNNEASDRSFVMNTFIFNNSLYYKPYEVVVATGIRSLRNVIDIGNTDSAAVTSTGYDLLVTKKFPKIRSSVDGGYSYITGLGAMYRHVWRLGFQATIITGLSLNVRAEKHMIHQQFSSTTINLCRITLIKSF